MSGNQKQQQTSHQNPATVKTKKTETKPVTKIDPGQLLSASETLRSEDVLAAQQQVGNQVVQRALDGKDRDRSVTDNQGNLSEDITRQIQSKRGGGSPLPDSIQQDASKKLGRKFNDVRIHTDETADKLSRSVSARAFTIGKDIFFKGGVFSPTTSAGRETLIHELTHVVQQSRSKSPSGGKLKLGAPDTAMEKEAAHMGKKHAVQQSAGAGPSGAVQRQGEEEELLQGQPDPAVAIQRQGIEEEEQLQGQPDPAAIQREGEEEELQMQPDAGGVIQRDKTQELEELRKGRHVSKLTRRFSAPAIVKSSLPAPKQAEAAPVAADPAPKKEDAAPVPDPAPKQAEAAPQKPQLKRSEGTRDLLKNVSKPQLKRSEGTRDLLKQVGKPQLKRSEATRDLLKKATDPAKPQLKRSEGTRNLLPNDGKSLAATQKMTDDERSEKIKAAFDPKGVAKEAKDKEKTEAKSKKAQDKLDDKNFALAAKDPKKFNETQAKAKEEEQAKAEKDSSRQKLMGTVSDPKASAEDRAAAKEKLDMLHKRSKMDKFKSFFKKGGSTKEYSEQAESQRSEAQEEKMKSLQAAAERGDDNAFKELKALKAEKQSESEKKEGEEKPSAVGGLFKKGLGFLGSKIKGFAAGKLNEAKEHYLGKKEEDDKEKDKSVTVNVNNAPTPAAAGGGGGGGGGSDGMAKTISDLYQKNQKLEAEIAELKKKAEPEKKPEDSQG